MTRLASAMMVLGVGLSVLGLGERDASAQVSGPGVYGVMQGGMCVAELSTLAPYVSYWLTLSPSEAAPYYKERFSTCPSSSPTVPSSSPAKASPSAR